MSDPVVSGQVLVSSYKGIRQLVVVVGTGDCTIQCGGGGNWVTIEDGVIIANAVVTFHLVQNQEFRIVLTGTAAAWLAG